MTVSRGGGGRLVIEMGAKKKRPLSIRFEPHTRATFDPRQHQPVLFRLEQRWPLQKIIRRIDVSFSDTPVLRASTT